jgi:hypothetical protein
MQKCYKFVEEIKMHRLHSYQSIDPNQHPKNKKCLNIVKMCANKRENVYKAQSRFVESVIRRTSMHPRSLQQQKHHQQQ